MSNQLPDIYMIMDEAGLNAGNLSNANKPLHQIVNEIRTDLASKLEQYLQPRVVKIDVIDGDSQ